MYLKGTECIDVISSDLNSINFLNLFLGTVISGDLHLKKEWYVRFTTVRLKPLFEY